MNTTEHGSRWWKFDFHNHTPASDDYGKGVLQEQYKQHSPENWLLDYMRAGIDCVAITDHNSGAWVDRLKSALAQMSAERYPDFRPLHLFPGVEISVYGGIHVLAIFGEEKSKEDIDALLSVCGFDGQKGSSNAVTRKSLIEVVSEIHRAGALAIPAHVDGPAGLFEKDAVQQFKHSGITLQQILECEELIAFEICDPATSRPQMFLDRKLRWTEVLGSDAHHPSGSTGVRYPGSHFTWCKMGTPSINGLRLALLDGEYSVRRSDASGVDPNVHAQAVLEAIEVRNAKYIGRPEVFRISFSPWLTTIIGGRGTGKSTALEFIRLALDRRSELPAGMQSEFAKYWNPSINRDDGNLLLAESVVSVLYRKDNTRFRIKFDQTVLSATIEAQQQDGTWTAESGAVQQRFPIRIYSQKQIFELARTPQALLTVIDEAEEVDRAGWNERWKEEQARYLALRAQEREIATLLQEEDRLKGELDDAKRKQAIFETAGHANVLRAFQLRIEQRQSLTQWEQSWQHLPAAIRNLTSAFPVSAPAQTFDEKDSHEEGVMTSMKGILLELSVVKQSLEDAAQRVEQLVAHWTAEKGASRWKLALADAEQKYEELCAALKDAAAGDPSGYSVLLLGRKRIEEQLQAMADLRIRQKQLQRDAIGSFENILRLRRELTTRRVTFLSATLGANPYVKMTVHPYGARETVIEEFRMLTGCEGDRFSRDIGRVGEDGLFADLYNDDQNADGIEVAIAKVKEIIRAIAAGTHEQMAVSDKRFAAHIGRLPPENLDRLEMWFPADSIEVLYSPRGDQTDFRSIQEGSPGQRTAALLAFLLSYGSEPIILDQPEDDLDNNLIYNLIVARIKSIKSRRQVIVVTHNANIVVNGDAELVIALIPRGGQTQRECCGCLQEVDVRNTICSIMEGGKDAFAERYRRISLDVRRIEAFI